MRPSPAPWGSACTPLMLSAPPLFTPYSGYPTEPAAPKTTFFLRSVALCPLCYPLCGPAHVILNLMLHRGKREGVAETKLELSQAEGKPR